MHRSRLLHLAYRMLGTVSEAEDIIQETYLRWQAVDQAEVASPAAFLTSVTTRLCLDQLRSARHRREAYLGPWLPEPLVEDLPSDAFETAQEVSVAMLMALERLSPLERAVFILHDVFEMGFQELAAVLERSEAACRQLAVRARVHVQDARQRFDVAPAKVGELLKAFMSASRQGDVGTLQALLAEEVIVYTDGGGKRPAALNPIRGLRNAVRFFEGLARKRHLIPRSGRLALISGTPGFVTLEQDGIIQTTALDIEDGRIMAIYIIRNPDKLSHLTDLRASLLAKAAQPALADPAGGR
ncbi:sigma-70 family RNA polymerase sigma factor [Geminicoccus sp.]|jgi:RNA polymerase sigma-70 factor (ECF subfamily)|uniref:sigma-70 family RNA polymerase sigma factor n=1 Tax=Geminicoccus sp. TaxID=2024832 RepID=UPI0039C89234